MDDVHKEVSMNGFSKPSIKKLKEMRKGPYTKSMNSKELKKWFED